MVHQFIESNPKIMMGKPVIKGTRITVELILEKLAAGETVEQILEAHPRVTKPAVQAALEFAAQAPSDYRDKIQALAALGGRQCAG